MTLYRISTAISALCLFAGLLGQPDAASRPPAQPSPRSADARQTTAASAPRSPASQKRLKLVDRVAALEERCRGMELRLAELAEQVRRDAETPADQEPDGGSAGDAKAENDPETGSEPRRCTATARSTGKRCKCKALPGKSRCYWHND